MGTVVALDEAAGSVTVRTETVTQHWFAPLIGIDQTDVAARASARWGYPAGGTAVLPLAFSWCELAQQLGITVLRNPITNEVIGLDIPEAGTAEANVYLTKSSETTCTGPSGNLIPGGFGWLVPSPSQCAKANLTIDGWAASDTGNSPPSICSAEEFASWVGKTILIPVFDDAVGNGSSGKYKVFGFAAFKLTSYYFAGQYKPLGTAPCSGNERCVRGKFVRFVDLGEDFQISPDAPKLGAVVVALTE